MKKYRNISNNRLSIDCISHTVYLEKGEIRFLPISRDVRHNLRLNNLVVIKELKQQGSENKKIIELPKPKVKKHWKQVKEEKADSDLKQMETE